jgi:hypothetical protein
MIVESNPTFWECRPLVGFMHRKAQGEPYHEPKHMQIMTHKMGRIHTCKGSYAYKETS